MKVKSTLILALACISLTLQAQEESKEKKVNLRGVFGIKLGPSLSGFSSHGTTPREITSSRIAGIFARIKTTDRLYFQPELIHTIVGGKNEIGESEYIDKEGRYTNKMRRKIKLEYIAMPLMLKYEVAKGLMVEAGPQIGLNVGAKYKEGELGFFGLGYVDEYSENISRYIKPIDVGINLGIGYELKSKFSFDLRLNLGLTNILEEPYKDIEKIKNNTVSFTLGYHF